MKGGGGEGRRSWGTLFAEKVMVETEPEGKRPIVSNRGYKGKRRQKDYLAN